MDTNMCESDCVLDTNNRIARATVVMEKVMDLSLDEPIPDAIYESFKRKFPDKSTKALKAYIMGYRFGLNPDTISKAKQFLRDSSAKQ